MKSSDVLDRMIAGESVDASPEVRELAQLAALLQGAWQEGPSEAAANRGMTAALAAFETNGNGNGAVATASIPTVRPARRRRMAVRLALAAALVIGLPVTAFAASEDALPGQLLYPVKRGFEEIRLAMAGDPLEEGAVLLDLAGERVEEIVLAKALGNEESALAAIEVYREIVARFEGRIAEAEALGLPTEELEQRAAGLFADWHRLVESLYGVPPQPPAPEPVVPVQVSASEGGEEKGSKGRREQKKNEDNRSGDDRGRSQASGGGGNSAGDNGGNGEGGNGDGGAGAATGTGTTTDPAGDSGNCGNGRGEGGSTGAGAGSGLGNTCDDEDDDEPAEKDENSKDDHDGGRGSGAGGDDD